MSILALTATGVSTGNIIFDVILAIAALVIGIYAVATNTKINIIDNIPRLIRDAQLLSDLAGPDKMKWVVSQLKEYIPKIFRIIFTEDILKEIAQNIYEHMKGYRENWIETKK